MRPVGRGRGRADSEGRQREEGIPGRENPGVDRGLITQVEDDKGGATGRGKSYTGSCEELLGMTSREESADKRWRLAVRGAVQVEGLSAPGLDGGGETGAKIYISGVNG